MQYKDNQHKVIEQLQTHFTSYNISENFVHLALYLNNGMPHCDILITILFTED